MKNLKEIGTILNKQQQKKINAGGIYPSFCEGIIFDFLISVEEGASLLSAAIH